jgi:hypothetical protein
MRQAYQVQRGENRVPMKVTVLLAGKHSMMEVEKVFTENVSSRGVRVISTCQWLIDDTLLVALPGVHFTSAARVTYCDPLGDGRFGTGLQFLGSTDKLQISALATAQDFPQT